MISAIIVDDEKRSIMNLELLLNEHCADITVVDRASTALEAVGKILSLQPDVVFLDVQMPGYNGFDVLQQIKDTKAIIIFTTAHKEYAIEALRKGAFDYLLKPIDSNELINSYRAISEKISSERLRQVPPAKGIIELSVKEGIIFVKPDQIIRLEASGSYTVFILDNNVRHVVSKSMKEYEAQLPKTGFYRCHNSHVVNLKKVVKFLHNNGYFAQMSDGSIIEIARKNKETFLEKLKKLEL
ncbi:MAG: LytTR family DNA-binding domain-containing protein [bacterium]|nr:LytTR family DNA-binding domain-containing protein [bacterium]